MTVPNPYFICIILKWPNGNLANKNEIARVRAYDIEGGVRTWESECGYDDATGGWKPAYMQNIAVFAGRGSPNLVFEVWSTAEQLIYTTPIQPSIASGTTVTIIINQSCTPGDDPWVVSGVVTRSDNTPVFPVIVTAYDVTNEHPVQLGMAATTTSPDGAYSITYHTSDFANNGSPHSSPNLKLVVTDSQSTELLAQDINFPVTRNMVIPLTLPGATIPGEYRVYGQIFNALGLPVQGVDVEAYHLTWSAEGPKEILLGAKATSAAEGKYEIRYEPPKEVTDTGPCTTVGQINLMVYASETNTTTNTRNVLDTVGVLFDAAKEQRVDLFVNKVAVSSDSEYARLHDRLSQCLGSTEEVWWNSINAFTGRPEYLTFLSKSTGFSETDVLAYGRAWTVAGEIDKWTRQILDPDTNAEVQSQLGVTYLRLPKYNGPVPHSPEIAFALVHAGLGDTLTKLLEVRPETLFNAWIDAAHQKVVSSDVELNISGVLADWKLLLGRVLATSTTDANYWQAQLINLALPGTDPQIQAKRAKVAEATFDFVGPFAELCAALAKKNDITEEESNLLVFTFDLYDAVGRFFGIVQKVVETNRSTKEWTTIADLSRVTLDRWYGFVYALDAQGHDASIAPPDVPGTGAEERSRVYAARLYALFAATSPDNKFLNDLTTSATTGSPEEDAADFFKDNPTFDLQRGNIDLFIEDWPDAEKPPQTTIDLVKLLQRLYRLTPDYATAVILAAAGYDSAVSIAREEEDDFIVKNEKALGGITVARNIHRTATYYANEVVFTIIKYNQNINATGGATALTAPVTFAALASKSPLDGYDKTIGEVVKNPPPAHRFPNWTTLFGDINKCACQQCQTVLSPGAYMVDVLQFIEKTFGLALFERRPDIADIEITCPNTNRMLPYIDLVNELLEQVVATTEGVESAFLLTVATSPTTVVPITEQELKDASSGDLTAYARVVQSFVEHGYVLGDRAVVKYGVANTPTELQDFIVEDDAWHFRIAPTTAGSAFRVWPYAQTSATNDSLEVFPEHYSPAAYDVLSKTIFPAQLPLLLGKEETAIFLEQRQVRRHEILEAFTTASMDTKLGDVTNAEAYLNLTHFEVQVILGQVADRDQSNYWGFDVADGASPEPEIEILRPDKPTIQIRDTWQRLLAMVPVFMHRAGISYQELLDLLDTEFVNVEVNAGERLRITCDAKDLVECNYNNYQITNLNLPTLGRLSCFLRLWRRIGWTMRELDRYLMEMEGGQIPGDLTRLSLTKRLAQELDLPILTVIAFFRRIDTFRTERQPRSLFDQTFLIGAPAQVEYKAFERLAVYDETIEINPANLHEDEDYPSYVRAALKVRSKDFEVLWTRFVDTNSGLDIERLTNLYRTAKLASKLGLGVTELDEMLALTGLDPLFDGVVPTTSLTAALLQTHAAIREIRRARALRLPVAEANYYLSDVQKIGEKYLPKDQDRSKLLNRLAGAAAEIASAIPKTNAPDSATLSAALGKVMPQDKVVQAVDAIKTLPHLISAPSQPTPPPKPERPSPSASPAEQAAYLDALKVYLETTYPAYAAALAAFDGYTLLAKYFPAFVPGDITAYLGNLTAIAGEDERNAFVFVTLRQYLQTKLTAATALTVATELTGLDPDTTDLLLTSGLSSTFTPARSNAFEDWKVFVSGGFALSNRTRSTSNGETADVTTQVILPKDGTYRFSVTIDSPTASGGSTPAAITNVRFAGTTVTPSETIVDLVAHTTRFEFSGFSVTQKAGSTVSVSLHYATVAASADAPVTVTLGWYIDNADLAAVPDSALVPYDDLAYLKLRKAVGLLKLLRLTKDETRFLITGVAGTESLDLDKLPLRTSDTPVAWSVLTNFTDLVNLNRTVALESQTLFELMSSPETPSSDELAQELGCKLADIETVQKLWLPNPAPTTKSPDFWYILNACRSIALRLDLRIEQVSALLLNPDPKPAVANTLRNVYRSRFTKDTWKDAFKPHRDALRQRQRDALVGYLTTRPVGADKDHEFFDSNELFGHYLIDVEMEPDTLISRLKLALNAIQLYVERIFLGLEPDTSKIDLGKAREQWAWMRNYRVWEANRKVFLYPENWIEPELRDDKSEFFREFEEELLADDISSDRGKVALTNYLEKLAEVSNLEIVGTYAQSVQSDPYVNILHVIGRTRYQPRTYYYRSFQGKKVYDGDWTPWRKITLDINADIAAPAVFNGRLYLFWLMVQTKQKSKPYPNDTEQNDNPREANGKNAFIDRANYQSEIRLMWSEYLAAEKKWLKPRVSKDRFMDYEVEQVPQREIGKDAADTNCYHLRIEEAGNESIGIDLIKTKEPDASGKLSPKQLGKFELRFNGHDSFNGVQQDLALGKNWPIGTVLRHNSAEEVPQLVEGVVGNDLLKFKGTAPFLQRTSETFRVYQTNFGYLDAAQYKPFFCETPTKSYFALNFGEVVQGTTTREAVQRVRFCTFNNPQFREIQSRFQAGGPASIMDRLVQALPVSENYYYNYYNFRSNYYYNYYGNLYLGYHIAGDSMAWGSSQRKFEIEYLPRTDSVMKAFPLPTVEFGYGTPFGLYNWELFFHAPLLIADRLTHDLKFEDAMNWYHFIFDPKQEFNSYEKTKRWASLLPPGCRYWNFLPFFANKSADDSLMDVLGLRKTLSAYERADLTALINEWRNNPFNPHLIARQRIVAYQKNVVMRYLDNLIGWGDQLFRQDTFESINRATQLYVLADELLGQRPERVEPPFREPRYTYTELKKRKFDAFSDAMVDVEYMVVANREHVKNVTLAPQTTAAMHIKNLGIQTAYFSVPRNERLDSYWDTVADRLFKIRNSMNIDGIKRQLALFEPPIDPALLVRAAAAGLDLGSVLSQLNSPLPLYRFSIWIQKAIDLCNEVKGFGAALLSALEKKDGEALQLLRQGHEIKMLELARKVRQRQIDEAAQNITALERSRVIAEERLDYYKTREKISGTERNQLRQTELAGDFELAQGVIHSITAILSIIPDLDVGIVGIFPQATGKVKIGSAILGAANAAAAIVGTIAGYHRAEANMAGITAGHERRWDDWQLQMRLAEKEIDQIDQQIIAAQIRQQIAEMELANHEVQMEHAAEVQGFLQDKFTNEELYQEMIRLLSATYKSIYKLAFDVAKYAERTFEFELGVGSPGFIQNNYMGSLRMGLLAGEQLVQDLKRMDIAYLEQNKREFEIQKSISLATLNGEALQNLRNTGECNFELPEVLFDLDFPGQYFRRIKAVRVTIPCVTGPHTSVSAKLSLVSSAIRKQSTASGQAEDYLYKGYDDGRFVHDLIGIQSIATSTAQNDAGLFELNFRDERYLPFEGGGVISRWHLELPKKVRQFDYDTISDVVLHLSYTARDAGGLLRQGADAAIALAINDIASAVVRDNPEGLIRLFSLRKEFPDVLHQLLAPPATPAPFENTSVMTLLPEHFPFFLKSAGAALTNADEQGNIGVYVRLKSGVSTVTLALTLQVGATGDASSAVTLHGGATSIKRNAEELVADWNSEDWILKLTGAATAIEDLKAVDDILFLVHYNATLA